MVSFRRYELGSREGAEIAKVFAKVFRLRLLIIEVQAMFIARDAHCPDSFNQYSTAAPPG